VLAAVVARELWKWNWFSTLAVTLVLLALDLSFFSANMSKLGQGGWFPLSVAAGVFFLMTTWKKGVECLRKRILDAIVPLEDFFELMHIERPARVPGTAVFMTSSSEGAPPALMQSLYHNRVVHQSVMLMTIKTEDVPYIPEDQRVRVEKLEHGFFRIIARYGFMETPDIPGILARDDTPTPPIEHTTFYLGRETIVPEGKYGMSLWRTKVFAMMARNALPASAFFEVPPSRVLEVGGQIEL
jgi:KUP system potassium uptake protein